MCFPDAAAYARPSPAMRLHGEFARPPAALAYAGSSVRVCPQ